MQEHGGRYAICRATPIGAPGRATRCCSSCPASSSSSSATAKRSSRRRRQRRQEVRHLHPLPRPVAQNFLFEPLIARDHIEPRRRLARICRPTVRASRSRDPIRPAPSSPASPGRRRRRSSAARKDSDNWPLTWADDDSLYTAYGDGNGFEPDRAGEAEPGLRPRRRRSGRFQGVNIRSATGERKGNGQRGKKASGLLDGRRRALHAGPQRRQLAARLVGRPRQDVDLGRLEVHRPASAARRFSTSARTTPAPATNSSTSTRPTRTAPTRRRTGWCWPASARTGSGTARPTNSSPASMPRPADLDARHRPRRRLRPSGPLLPPDRQLQRRPPPLPARPSRLNPRRFAGFGIYDAPEPWGPWTTVTHAPHWDIDPGETGSIPTKWISPDGRTIYLVFSGGDAFDKQYVAAAVRLLVQLRIC